MVTWGGLRAFQEVSHDAIERLRLLGVGQVRGVVDHRTPRARHVAVVILGRRGRCLVVSPANEKRRRLDFLQPIHLFVVPQRAGNGKLARAVHVKVHVVAHFLRRQGALEVIRPGIKPANVPGVIGADGGLVFGRVECARRLGLPNGPLDIGGHLQRPRPLVGDPSFHAERRPRQGQACHTGGPVPQHVLDREDRSPGVAQDMNAMKLQRRADAGKLVDVAINRPQRTVLGAIGVAAPELVVEHNGALVSERSQRFEVVMRDSRPAVQDQQRNAGPVFANDPIPDFSAVDRHLAIPHNGRPAGHSASGAERQSNPAR